MNNIYRIFLIICSTWMVSCHYQAGFQNENGITFESEKLNGKYLLDISEIVMEVTKPTKNTSSEKVAISLFRLAAPTSIKGEIAFYDNGRGVSHIDYGWLGALFSKENKTGEFQYHVERDSILIVGTNELTIRKFSDSFDYIELISKKDNLKYTFNKIAE